MGNPQDWTPDDSVLPQLAIGAARDESAHDEYERDSGSAGQPAPNWRPVLNRWLLTLNPGRTQDEYAKAVRYFFETPGAPQRLGNVTADILLAYRGALTLRADRRRRSMPRRHATARRGALWTGNDAVETLAGATSEQTRQPPTGGAFARPASLRQGPLSPATVNIRLTALRQFLLFALEQDALPPTLSAERVRSALRRLRNERRRPYQILAEEEWDDFLRAALSPAAGAAPESADSAPTATNTPPAQRSPWGVTRALREQERQHRAAEEIAAAPTADIDSDGQASGLAELPPQGRRTGAHTAQRDHALISLALATGLRAIELSLLDVGDLVSERRRGTTEWWLSLPDEKTKGQRGGRTLPLAPELVQTLLDYIRATGRAWDNSAYRLTPLFLALTRGRSPYLNPPATSPMRDVALAWDASEPHYRRLRPEQIRGVIHRVEAQWLAQQRAEATDTDAVEALANSSQNRHISPHALRHSAAIALLLGDEASDRPPASVEHVRGWLGHFDIRTTQRYLAHIESRDQRRRFAIRPPSRASTTPPQPDASASPSQPAFFEEPQGE